MRAHTIGAAVAAFVLLFVAGAWLMGTSPLPASLDGIGARIDAVWLALMEDLSSETTTYLVMGAICWTTAQFAAFCVFRYDRGGPAVILVESDQRKAAFLREAARAMEISVEILSTRIESDANLAVLRCVDFVTARALAQLPRLFSLVSPFLSPAAVCIFLKGRTAAREIAEAREVWSFELDVHPSLTEEEASVLVVRAIEPRSGTGQQTE